MEVQYCLLLSKSMYWEHKDQHQWNSMYLMVNGFELIDVLLTQCCDYLPERGDKHKVKLNDMILNC